MPQIAALDPDNPQNNSRPDQTLSESRERKSWVRPSASVEQVRDVTTSNFRGSRSDGTSICSS
jgi:hypothetical protein